MKKCTSILVVMLAAGSLLATAALEQERVASVGISAGQEVLVMDSTLVALPRHERRQNPWIRLDRGEELLSDDCAAPGDPVYTRT